MTVSDIAAHEARHAAAALALDVPLVEAAVNPDGGGYVLPDWDLGDRDRIRDHARMILAGRLGGRGWPPAWPSKSATTRDERQAAVLADHLGLGQAGWDDLVAEAWALSDTSEFRRLETGIEYLLAEGHTLDGPTLKRVQLITKGIEMQSKTVEAQATATDRGVFSAIAAAYSVDRQGE